MSPNKFGRSIRRCATVKIGLEHKDKALEHQRIAAVELPRILRLDSKVDLLPQDTGQTRLTLIGPRSALGPLILQALESRPELKQSRALVSAAWENNKGAV